MRSIGSIELKISNIRVDIFTEFDFDPPLPEAFFVCLCGMRLLEKKWRLAPRIIKTAILGLSRFELDARCKSRFARIFRTTDENIIGWPMSTVF